MILLMACTGPVQDAPSTVPSSPEPPEPSPSTADTGPDECGPLVWAQRIGAAGSDGADDLVRLSDGGFAVSGSFSYTVVFGGGEPGEIPLTSQGGVLGNLFVAAFDADGALRWVRAGYGPDVVGSRDLVADDAGLLAVGGLRGSSATFGTTTLPANGLSDGFVAVLTEQGDFRWVASATGSSLDAVEGVALTRDAVYATGTFEDDLAFPDGTVLTNPDDDDGWLARYDLGGAFSWARHVGGVGRQEPVSVSATDDAVAVLGEFTEGAQFAGGATPVAITADGLYSMLFLAQWAVDGTVAWARSDGGPTGEEAPQEVAPIEQGWAIFGYTTNGVFGAGEPNETVFPQDSSWSIYRSTYGMAGSLSEATALHSSDFSTSLYPYGMDVADDGLAVVAGYANGNVVLGAGTQRQTTVGAGYVRDPFVATWRGTEFQCSWRIEGSTPQPTDQVDGVAYDAMGGFWVAGRFSDSITLAPGTPEETVLTSAGETDVFLARFLLDPR